MKKTILYIFLMLSGLPQFGQVVNNDQNKINLAYSYFRNSDFEKAAPLFLELYEKTKASQYFDYYINSLISLQQYDEAEKALKKVMRTDKNPNNYITLGYLYKSKNDMKAAGKVFDDVIDNLSPNMGTIVTVANTFFNKGEFDYAEKAYLKGRELIKGEMFRSYLATVYAYKRDYNKMMQEYMAMLTENEKNLANVQGRLSSLMRFDFDNSLRNLIKREVLLRIQAAPEEIVFSKLLIWIFVQEENYTQAMNQSMALDRRTRAEEENILSFAKSAAERGLYDVALSGVKYLIERKPEALNLKDAKQEQVNFEYLKLINSPVKDEPAMSSMENKFRTFFSEFGYNTRTASLVRDYAHFMAFYRHNPEFGLSLLEEAMKSKELDANQYTLMRIELADVNVCADNLWEASLQYSQIIEANKSNPMGDEVKLKKAKLSYFQGEIDWAKAQLDVLKASTSKLIANDAMELWLLISNHYNLDTIVEPVRLFALADLDLFRNRDDLALEVLDSLVRLFPGHSLNEPVLMRKALICERAFDFKSAAGFYNQVLETYSFSSSADDALFRLAWITEKEFNDPEKAQTYYKQILVSFPGSIYVADARKKFREIRGDFKSDDPFDLLQESNRPYIPE